MDFTSQCLQEENNMNGYTPTTPYKTRIQNLLYNIPVTERPKAIADAWTAAKQEIDNASKYDFERHLTAISYGFIADPRTEWERDWDDHCAEVQATRESDMPRGW